MSVLNCSCFFLIFLISVCCGQALKDNDLSRCSEFSRLATAKVQDYLLRGRDTIDLVQAASFYDQAILCDPSNSLHYQGKLTTVNMLGRFSESLKLIDKIYQLSGENDIQMIVAKAVIFEQTGAVDSSNVYYRIAYQAYDSRLAAKPPDSLRIVCERLYLTAIVEGKESAISKLKPYLERHPEDPTLIAYHELFLNFDRQSILSSKK
jgi:hypothetical protein